MINLRNPKEYSERFLKIIDKKQRLVPLAFKPAQEALYTVIREEHAKGKPVRIVVLKGRQLGCSTMIEGVFFADSATSENASTLIMAHDDDATKHLFEMNKLFYDELPEALKPMKKASNAQELVFENPTKDPTEKKRRPGLRSRIRCITAGGKGGGRSFTFRNVHGSECAFWPNFRQTHNALMAAVPKTPDTCVIYETTANGLGEFKDFWDDAAAGRNDFRAVFLPWYLDPDYRRPVEGESASAPPTGGSETAALSVRPVEGESASAPPTGGSETAVSPVWPVEGENASAPSTGGSGTAVSPPWTDYERELMERVGLTPEQLSWRRYTIRNDCAGDEALFRQEYPTFPEEAFLTTGRPYFDNEKINVLAGTAPEPVSVGFFEYTEAPDGRPEGITWREDPRGFVRLWALPERGTPYVLGADSAGDGTDRFTVHGVCNVDGAQVCEYENPVSEILFARQLYCLGRYFNNALIALEVNYGSYAELMLEQWGYPRLYQRQRYDEIKKSFVSAYGWRTDTRTRPTMLANLRAVAAETPDCLRSRWLLEQMLRFQYDDAGKPQGVEGEHDDLVIAAAICHMARAQQRYTVTEAPETKREKLIDQLERRDKHRRKRQTR